MSSLPKSCPRYIHSGPPDVAFSIVEKSTRFGRERSYYWSTPVPRTQLQSVEAVAGLPAPWQLTSREPSSNTRAAHYYTFAPAPCLQLLNAFRAACANSMLNSPLKATLNGHHVDVYVQRAASAHCLTPYVPNSLRLRSASRETHPSARCVRNWRPRHQPSNQLQSVETVAGLSTSYPLISKETPSKYISTLCMLKSSA